MAYEHNAANSSHSAEIVSPRAMASTPQQTAPTTATAVQMSTDFIDRPLPVAGPDGDFPPPGSVVMVPAMTAPLQLVSAPETPAGWQLREPGAVPAPRCDRTVIGSAVRAPLCGARPRAVGARTGTAR
jgi:hypothetical protein